MTDLRVPERDGMWRRMKERGGRGDRSAISMWFWDIDRVLLLLALLLIAIGLIAVGAASPAAAQRYSDDKHHIPPLFYLWWQLGWVGVSLPVLIVTSMLPVTLAKRMALIGAGVCLLLLIAVPFIGFERNGATRWIDFGVSAMQPSEFLKPFFIVSVAWILSLRAQDGEMPVVVITGAMTAFVAVLLMLQPDFGQTVVFCSVWIALLMISGTSPKVMAGLIGCVPVGLIAAYMFYDTARVRIDAFLFPGAGEGASDNFQTNAAYNAITNGGWRGTGPGGGTMKFRLPEGHTDYIYSVIGEEFGLLACAIIALLFLAIVVRVFVKLLDEQDEFRLFAAAGLATQFGAQALISMAVNTGMAPSKGMTLPFISYGGSSMIALSIGMGLLLAFTRRNPFVSRSPYIARWSGE
ncbi:peptidoglycan glycosyltransferase FtsW [Sphingomonas endolithica]|uniref:peptidoglycan glycosyltransferase FtsW n=1 Tax=Sphingomonas endolithica TaxID=2972485 RepID=UPI0021AFD2D6|nr:putative peptidoglycan glycosyltransferase FtsW [Sphingomonas sp. ZFBP2030]